TIKIEENNQYRVGNVKVTGARLFSETAIKEMLDMNSGEVFNEERLRKGIENLKKQYGSQGYINFIAVPVQGFDEANKHINLNIKEKNRNYIGFSGGVSGIGGGFLGINYENNNFMGLGETLGITLQGGTRQSLYQFSFTQPYLFDRPLTAGLTVFDTRLRFDQATEGFGFNS